MLRSPATKRTGLDLRMLKVEKNAPCSTVRSSKDRLDVARCCSDAQSVIDTIAEKIMALSMPKDVEFYKVREKVRSVSLNRCSQGIRALWSRKEV